MRSSTGQAGFLFGCLILCFTIARTQGLYPISTDEKISRSSLIIEGKVIDKKSWWNSAHTMIYTTNQVEVYKVFKGTLQKNIVDIVTLGGLVDDHYIQASHLLHLENNEIGVFFCRPPKLKTPPAISTRPQFEVFSSSQGFIKYDLFSKTAAAPFVQYDNIEKILYKELTDKTGRRIEIKNPSFNIEKPAGKVNANNSTLAPVITSFSPATVDAGALMDPTNNILTINGTGFGNSPGSNAAVLFSHSDYASGTQFHEVWFSDPSPMPPSPLIISWTDTEIKIRVPTQAGTGPFRVRDNAGVVVNSPTNLNVRYSILTADFQGAYGWKQFNLGNMNTSGGYSVKYSTNTANSGVNINTSPAKATFQRALNTWKESIGVNFVEAGTTSIQNADPYDGENVVMYDNSGWPDGPLMDGVLATCVSGITICGNNPAANQARKTGFDIVIRNTGYSSGTTAFTLGPCPPYSGATNAVDLETVLLHELGHALNLAHIIDPQQGSGGTGNPAKVMHFSISYNLRRISIDYAAKTGGLYQVTPHSYTYGTCVVGAPEMTPLATTVEGKDDCPASFPVVTTPMFTTVNFDLAHSMSNRLVDPAYTQMRTDGIGTSMTNTAYYPFRTNSSGGDLSLEILNYVTLPVEIAACTPGVGIPVTGVKMSVYQVASCPVGGSYPTPVAHLTFQSNGTLAPISSLAASTTYLMVLDGIQNTKALFDVVFSGSALPMLSTDLSGEIVGNYNQLMWTTDPAFGVTAMVLERSADGVTFVPLEEIEGQQQQESGQFADLSPLPGTNYYRLRVQNSSGNTQYSRVVLLNRSEDFSLIIYPNPAGPSFMNVEINSNEPGKFAITMHNTFGQLVLQKDISVTGRKHVESIPIGGLMKGVYYIAAYNKDGKRIKAETIKLK